MTTRRLFKQHFAHAPQVVAVAASMVLGFAAITSAQTTAEKDSATLLAAAPTAQQPLKIGFIASLTGVGADPSKTC